MIHYVTNTGLLIEYRGLIEYLLLNKIKFIPFYSRQLLFKVFILFITSQIFLFNMNYFQASGRPEKNWINGNIWQVHFSFISNAVRSSASHIVDIFIPFDRNLIKFTKEERIFYISIKRGFSVSFLFCQWGIWYFFRWINLTSVSSTWHFYRTEFQCKDERNSHINNT